jgi:outer membrane receptor protein involved in Fe transport
MKYDFGRGTYLAANYTYYKIKTEGTDTRGIEQHIGKFMTNIRLSRHFNFFADCSIFSGHQRWGLKDTRGDHAGYGVVNATLIGRKFLKRHEELELRGSVYNLFDEDYTMPHGQQLPNDLPMPGINFLVEIRCKL